MRSQINIRDRELPDAIRIGIRDACRSRGWRQAELVRIRGFDLVFVPRQVLPVVEAVIKRHYREQQNPNAPDEDLPLYAIDDAGEGDPGPLD